METEVYSKLDTVVWPSSPDAEVILTSPFLLTDEETNLSSLYNQREPVFVNLNVVVHLVPCDFLNRMN